MRSIPNVSRYFCSRFRQIHIYVSCLELRPQRRSCRRCRKKISKISIEKVNTAILAIVLSVGIVLGGKAGVGTIISAFGLGTVMQFIFSRFHFEPRSVNNLSLKDFADVLLGKYK